jgi:Tol biopolymer transport system component
VRSGRAIPAMICLLVVHGVTAASEFHSAVLPANLSSAAVFHPALERMLQSSPTFRRQCRRLAGASHLRVNVVMEELSRRPSHRARAGLQYRNGLLVSADIHLTPFDEPEELIAHEIEHVIEQLDGVDLEIHARVGTAWKKEDGAFETRRAIEVGGRVARDVKRPATGSPPLRMEPPPPWRQISVVAQHDSLASVHDQSSARVSADARFIVLASTASLSPADRNTTRDIYVFDVSTNLATLETPGAAGPSNGDSFNADISGDGRYIVFESAAGNLTKDALAPGVRRVFWRDRQSGVTRLLSTTPSGDPANGVSMTPAISTDGAVAAFASSATNIVGDDMTNGKIGIYRIELSSNRRSRVDATRGGRGPAHQSASPTLSGDGRYVAFASDADGTTLDEAAGAEPRDENRVFDIYVRDVLKARTRRVSIGASGSDSDGPSYHPAISIDGRHVAFVSDASNLTSDRIRSQAQVFVRDMETGAIEMVSRTPAGRPGNAPSARPALSGDGRVIAYQSLASNLLCENRCRTPDLDINLLWDVYVYDRRRHQTSRASGGEAEAWMENSRGPSLDESGRVLTFASAHSGSPEDEAHDEDLFILEATSTRDATSGSSRSASGRSSACSGEPGCAFRRARRPGASSRMAP